MTRTPSASTPSVLARRGLAGGLAALVLLAASACGGSSDEAADPVESSTAAAETSGSDTPSSEAPSTDDESPAAPEPEVAAGDTVDRAAFVDLFTASVTQATTAHATMETTSALGGLSAEGDIDFRTTPQSMQLTMDLKQLGGDVELRLVKGIAYMKLPQLGGKYARFDLSDPDNPLGTSFADQLDIESQIAAFADSIQEVSYLGPEDVDGEELERYSFTVDGQTVADQANGTGLGAGADLLPEVITYDVWFDADGLFRKMTVDLGKQAGTTTLTYSDWGKDVTIKAPPASQVTTVPGLPGAS